MSSLIGNFELYEKVLSTIEEKPKSTNGIFKEVNFDKAKVLMCLNYCFNKKIVERIKDENKRFNYSLTKKGKIFLSEIR